MNSDGLLNQLISIDTLMSLDGVIPSLSRYQAKLITLMGDLSQALCLENAPEQEARELCQILCRYIDKHAEQRLKKSFLTWRLYSLENYFYVNETQSSPLAQRLEALLQSQDDTIRRCAMRLLILLPEVEEGSPALEARFVAHSRHATALEAPQPPPANEGKRTAPTTQKLLTPSLYGDVLIMVGLAGALWLCCFHYLENLYQCLF